MNEGIDKQTVRAALRLAILEALGPWKQADAAAAYLGVSRSWLLAKRREGGVPAYANGSVVRFKTEDLDKLFTKEQ